MEIADAVTNRSYGCAAERPFLFTIRVIGLSVGLVSTNAVVLTGLATFRVVGKPEVVLGPDFFNGQVVNALLYCVGLSETDPPPQRRVACELVSGFVY